MFFYLYNISFWMLLGKLFYIQERLFKKDQGIFFYQFLNFLVLHRSQAYLHDGNLLNGKNQVADNSGILKKIDSQILNLRIIIIEFHFIGFLALRSVLKN